MPVYTSGQTVITPGDGGTVVSPSTCCVGNANSQKYTIVKSFTLTEDGSYALPVNTLLTCVIVQPDSELAAFSIGTTDGGGELYGPTIVEAGGDPTPFILAAYSSSAWTVWFNGVTSSTNFQIYYI